MFGNGFPAFLFTKAQTELMLTHWHIECFSTLFTVLLVVIEAKVKVSQLIGILFGLSGAVWLIAGGGLVLKNASYSWYVIIATMLLSV